MTTPPAKKRPITDEQRFQYLIAGISDYAIYMIDVDGFVSSWNAGAQRFKGYQADEILGKHFSMFHTPEDQAAGIPGKALRTAQTEGKFEAEGWRVRKDGTRFWASVVIDAIYDNTGSLIGYAKVTRDITERKAAQEALRESEQRFRMLVQGVTDYAIYMLSPEGVVTNWNVGAERIKGYSWNDVVGTHFSRFYTPEDRARGIPVVALDTASRVGRFEQEGWRVRKDGSNFWAHVVIDAVRAEDGQLVGFAKITRDLTEKKKADEALERANAALFQSQKMESIGQLTGGIAHDFNNLLSVLSSGLEVLTLNRHSHADDKTFDSMRRAVQRGATLTQQLLAFARQQPLQAESRNVNKLITGFESVLRRATHSSIAFDLRLGASLKNVVIDSARFESALLNLVVNARDAMPDGGMLSIVTESITLSDGQVGGLPGGEYVLVSVNDSGTGMSPEVVARAFEPFFTTKEVGKGTGLGLSQVYGFITQSGGEVVLENRQQGGTAIRIYLPAGTDTAEPAEQQASTETVLIVEDEPDLLDVAAALFQSMGYNVLSASSGHQGLTLLAKHHVDILFTDVIMPDGMNGIELATRTRQDYPAVKVILASGYPLPALRAQHANLSEFPFINKPYRLADLAKHLRTAV